MIATHRLFAALLALAAACAPAAAKPPVRVPVKQTPAPPKPEFVDAADAADAMAAYRAVEIAQLRWQAAKERVEGKYQFRFDDGEGWDADPDGKLRVRRIPREIRK